MASKLLYPLFGAIAIFGVGCGSVKETPDASTIDADESGTATVETEAMLYGGTVGANVGMIDVVSNLPNNTMFDAIKTDAAGNGTIKVYPGGSVTAIYRRTLDMGAEFVTYLGVKPNDTLIFGSRNFTTGNVTNNNIGSQTYSWDIQPGATNHCAYSACNSNCAGNGTALNTAFAEFSTCNRGTMDVVYLAYNASGMSHYSSRQNITFANNQVVGYGGWIPMATVNVNMTGIPAEVTTVTSRWYTILDSHYEFGFGPAASGAPTGGAFTASYAFHPTGERTLAKAFLSRPGGYGSIIITDQFNTGTRGQTIAAPSLPPWLQGAVASSGLRRVSWNQVSSPGAAHDGTVVLIAWNRNVGGTLSFFRWYVIVPPEVSSFILPKLPAAFDAVDLQSTDSVGTAVQMFDLPTTGYDAIRAQPSRNIMCINCALRSGELTRAITSGATVE